jgi:hypothetical protein
MCFTNGDDNSTVAPQCADLDFDISAISDDMSALTNIYDKELVCELPMKYISAIKVVY